jgi:GntR family phosphonate transport system transcriptional regulator
MNLSRQPEPLYRELATVLRDELVSMKAGDYLPPEMELAARFSVNRHTLRRAMDELVLEGRLLRQQGKGTRVLPKPMIYPMQADSTYSASLSAQGHQVEARLLERRLRGANHEEREQLELEEGAELVEIATLRLIAAQPVSLIRHAFRIEYATHLSDYRGGSLRQHLSLKGVVLVRKSSLIGARLPTQEEANRLLMPRHAPLLSVQTLSCDADGRPVELSLSTSRADRFKFQLAL